jgi:hypothetical protein
MQLYKLPVLVLRFMMPYKISLKTENIPAKEVLSKLWDATKGFIKTKFGRPVKAELLPEDAEILMEQANKAEKEGFSSVIKDEPIEVKPEVVQEKPEVKVPKPEKPIETKLPDQQLESDLSEAKKELAELERTQGKGATNEKSLAIQKINSLELEKHNRAKEVPPEEDITFSTSKGSIYRVNGDGSTTRNKAARKDHPDEGLQPKSEKTWYVTPEESLKLGEFQTRGEDKAIVELPNGQLGVQYLSGNDKGKIEQRTLVDFSKQPEEGLIPVEAWENGKKIHFGNQIVKVEKPKPVTPEPQEMILSSKPPKEDTVSGETLPKKPTQVPPKSTRPRQPVKGKKQAVARSKIIKLFRSAFTDPIRLGKFRQRASGIHKLWPKVTRLLKDNDVETAAHEIGHNLHTTLYGGDAKTPQDQAKNISAALNSYLDELKPLAHYEPWGMEGFAEFTRLYVTNPEIAQELAPNFYNKFETDLEAQYPEMKNALLEARDYYDQYLHGTPQSRIRAQTSYGSDKGKLANITEAVKKWLNPDFLKTQFLDDVYPAKRLVAEAFGIPISEVEKG